MTGIEVVGAVFLITMLTGGIATVDDAEADADTAVKACLMCIEMDSATHVSATGKPEPPPAPQPKPEREVGDTP